MHLLLGLADSLVVSIFRQNLTSVRFRTLEVNDEKLSSRVLHSMQLTGGFIRLSWYDVSL